MSKEVEVKEVENEEVKIAPDLNTEAVKALKDEIDSLKKEMVNKVDTSKEKSIVISEEKPNIKAIGEKMKTFINSAMNKGLIEGATGSGSTVAVPQELQAEILRQASETGVVRRLATKIPMTSQTLKMNVTDTEPDAIWGDQALGTGDGTGASYTSVTFTRKPLEVKTVVSNPLIEDSENILPHLSEIGGSAIRRAEDRMAVIKMTAVAGNEVELTGTFTQGALTLGKMRDLYNAGTYERTGQEVFLMHRNTWAKVQTLTDNVNVVDFTNKKFYGVPVEIVNSMTDPIANDGTNVVYAFCCDMSKAVGLGVRHDEEVKLNIANQATVNGVSMFDTNQSAVKYQVDEDLQVMRPKYVSKLVSAH